MVISEIPTLKFDVLRMFYLRFNVQKTAFRFLLYLLCSIQVYVKKTAFKKETF